MGNKNSTLQPSVRLFDARINNISGLSENMRMAVADPAFIYLSAPKKIHGCRFLVSVFALFFLFSDKQDIKVVLLEDMVFSASGDTLSSEMHVPPWTITENGSCATPVFSTSINPVPIASPNV